jgi:BirA family transcriptional regulator, biotin operon repressor / biotin---[acetyl-CoA-carboxylase] ligase
VNSQAGDPLSLESVRRRLTTRTFGAHLVVQDQVDSTNRLATTLAQQGARHGTVVVAESQTHGRGRLGRPWVSPAGRNLYVSILIQDGSVGSLATWLPLIAALAVRRSVNEVTGLMTSLKWPNDVMSSRTGTVRKVAGVLAESTERGMVIGIGLNVNMALADFPDDLRSTASSLLIELGQPADRTVLLAKLLGSFEELYEALAHHPQKVMVEYRGACDTLRKRVRVELTGQPPLEGYAETIANDGALCVKTAGGQICEVRAGDVVHLR